MANKWGKKSLEVRSSLHPYLMLILDRVLEHCDMSLVEGFRTDDRQNLLYTRKASKVRWPGSKHNRTLDPSLEASEFRLSDAVDVIPWPEGYEDVEQMTYLIGQIKATADIFGIKLRCGLDWNGDGTLNNEKGDFFDVCHIELLF